VLSLLDAAVRAAQRAGSRLSTAGCPGWPSWPGACVRPRRAARAATPRALHRLPTCRSRRAAPPRSHNIPPGSAGWRVFALSHSRAPPEIVSPRQGFPGPVGASLGAISNDVPGSLPCRRPIDRLAAGPERAVAGTKTVNRPELAVLAVAGGLGSPGCDPAAGPAIPAARRNRAGRHRGHHRAWRRPGRPGPYGGGRPRVLLPVVAGDGVGFLSCRRPRA